jgi:hypothetical protein
MPPKNLLFKKGIKMENAEKLLSVLFSGRIEEELSAGRDIKSYREIGIADDDIVEKMLMSSDAVIGGLLKLGIEKNNKSMIEAGKKILRKNIMVIACLAFEHILENNYLTSKTK